jgi:hypothetical protein
MPAPSRWSLLAVSRFNSRKLVVVMSIVVTTLTIDSQLGNIADFITEQLASSVGVITFIGIGVIFAVTQYYILAYVKQVNIKESRARAQYLNTLHRIVTIVQFTLVGITALVILEILIAEEYNTATLYAALSISYGLWIVTLALLARAFFSWYKLSNRNVMVLIFALSMVSHIVTGVLGLYTYISDLSQKNSVIRLGDVAVFPKFSASIFIAYSIASVVAYILTWTGTMMLLRSYMKKLGKIRFWIIMAAALVYYLIAFPLFTVGYFTPSENSDAMTNILIFSLSAVFSGIVFGAAFLSIARTLQTDSAIRNSMIIAAYGFVLFYVTSIALVSQAAYPPYGLASISFTGLSCYLIYNGLYFSAISVSQDTALRQSIRKSVMEQSKLLDSIGTAQMEKELQSRVLTITKKASDIMTENTGVEASMNEDDIKNYMELVMREIHGKQ